MDAITAKNNSMQRSQPTAQCIFTHNMKMHRTILVYFSKKYVIAHCK